VESKGSAVNIELLAVYFEKKEVCEFCSGVLSGVDSPAGHAVSCVIPATSITRVPGASYVDLPLTLPEFAWPSYATNRTITWSGTGVSSGVFTPTSAGTVTLTATVTDGTATGTDLVKTFDVVVTAAKEVELVTADLTQRAFGYGSTYDADTESWTIGASFQRAGFAIGSSIYNELYEKVTLIVVASQNGRFGVSVGANAPLAWANITADGENEVTVEIDLTVNTYDNQTITHFAIENAGDAEGTFKIISVTFELKD
ncbi:MAG: hypothetical protein FWB86_14910, partial [Treponema sp.]|nr:hypothetical protein [Treponema sp.]